MVGSSGIQTWLNAAGTEFDVDYDTSRTGHSGGLTGSENYTSDPYKTSSAGHGQGLAGSGNYASDNYGSDSQRVGNTEYGSTGTGTRGPHSSNLGNKADPRVDSGKMKPTSQNSDTLTPLQMEVGLPREFTVRAESDTPATAPQALDWAQLARLPLPVHIPQT